MTMRITPGVAALVAGESPYARQTYLGQRAASAAGLLRPRGAVRGARHQRLAEPGMPAVVLLRWSARRSQRSRERRSCSPGSSLLLSPSVPHQIVTGLVVFVECDLGAARYLVGVASARRVWLRADLPAAWRCAPGRISCFCCCPCFGALSRAHGRNVALARRRRLRRSPRSPWRCRSTSPVRSLVRWKAFATVDAVRAPRYPASASRFSCSRRLSPLACQRVPVDLDGLVPAMRASCRPFRWLRC